MLSRNERIAIAVKSKQETYSWGLRTDQEVLPKVAIIARVSSNKQEKEGTIDSQIKFCHELFARYFPHNPKALVHVSLNEGYNLEAKNLNFDFWNVMNMIRNGEINHVISVSMDRLFRGANKVLNAEISQIFTSHRVKLITSDGLKSYDPTNIQGQLIDSVQETLGPVAKMEMTRKLQKARRYHLTENKQWRMSVVPFGYAVKVVGAGRSKQYVYSVIDDEAKIILDIFKLYCNEPTKVIPSLGVKSPGVKLIAGHLQRLGISKDGWLERVPAGHQAKDNSKKWNGVFINRILRNPIYRGDLIIAFNETAANASYQGEALVQKISVPPIIPLKLWDKVHVMRGKKSSVMQELFAQSAQDKNWLHHTIQCPTCQKESLLRGCTSVRKERYYTCPGKRIAGEKHGSYRAQDIEKNLGKLLLTKLKEGLLWEHVVRVRDTSPESAGPNKEQELDLLRGRLGELNKELNRTTELLIKGVISEEQYSVHKVRLDGETREIQLRLAVLDKGEQAKKVTNLHLKRDIQSLQQKFNDIMSEPSPKLFHLLREVALTLVERIEIAELSELKLKHASLEVIKTAYEQGRILPGDLETIGWSCRKIKKELGLSGRKTRLNFKLKVVWKTGKQEVVEVW